MKYEYAEFDLTDEEQKVFDKLTHLERRTANNVMNGMKQYVAYSLALGKEVNDSQKYKNGGCKIMARPHVKEYVNLMVQKAAKISLCKTCDIVEALMNESGILKDDRGDKLPAPEDTTQSARVSALKTLTDYTGGFDKNTNKQEITQYKEKSLFDLYDDDDH